MTQVYLSGSQHSALLERCDRCHAPVVERVQISLGELTTGELLFCGHHYREYKEALGKMGVVL